MSKALEGNDQRLDLMHPLTLSLFRKISRKSIMKNKAYIIQNCYLNVGKVLFEPTMSCLWNLSIIPAKKEKTDQDYILSVPFL